MSDLAAEGVRRNRFLSCLRSRYVVDHVVDGPGEPRVRVLPISIALLRNGYRRVVRRSPSHGELGAGHIAGEDNALAPVTVPVRPMRDVAARCLPRAR